MPANDWSVMFWTEKTRNERLMMATRLEQLAIEYVSGEHMDSREKASMF